MRVAFVVEFIVEVSDIELENEPSSLDAVADSFVDHFNDMVESEHETSDEKHNFVAAQAAAGQFKQVTP